MTALYEIAELVVLIDADVDAAAIEVQLAAATDAIEQLAGPLGEIVETHRGGSEFVILNRIATSVRIVTEEDGRLTLAADDWSLGVDGRSLRRLPEGTNPELRFNGRVAVTFQTADDLAIRRAVALELVKTGLMSQPGVLGLTEGNFTIQFANGQTWSSLRDGALEATRPPWGFA